MKQPLLLERYFFTKVHIDANPPVEGKEKATPISTSINVRTAIDLMKHEKEPHRYQLALTIHNLSCDDQPLPYVLEMQAVGFFVVHPEFIHDNIEKLIVVNGASMLYSAMREFVLMTTGRGPWGAFQLPTISFYDIASKQEKAFGQAVSSPPKTKRKPKP